MHVVRVSLKGMNHLLLFLNDASTQYDIAGGEMRQFHFAVAQGHLSIVIWCETSACSTLRMMGLGTQCIEEQFGKLHSFQLVVDMPLELVLTIAVKRQIFTRAQTRSISKALRILKNPSQTKALDVQAKAALILRASVLTTKVATFLADEEEFCVVKRKAWMKGKKLLLPRLNEPHPIDNISACLQLGDRQWRQCSGSFSTMMRFIQRSKELFKWHAELASLFLRRKKFH